MQYQIYGDYALTSETLLEEFDNKAEAIRWVQGYTKQGDLGGYESIEVMRIAHYEAVKALVEKHKLSWPIDDMRFGDSADGKGYVFCFERSKVTA